MRACLFLVAFILLVGETPAGSLLMKPFGGFQKDHRLHCLRGGSDHVCGTSPSLIERLQNLNIEFIADEVANSTRVQCQLAQIKGKLYVILSRASEEDTKLAASAVEKQLKQQLEPADEGCWAALGMTPENLSPFHFDESSRVSLFMVGDLVKCTQLEFRSGSHQAIVAPSALLKYLKSIKLSPSNLKLASNVNPKEKTGKTQKASTNLEGITALKKEDFAAWYPEVLVKAELIEYYDVSGCYVLRPWAYSIWERIQSTLDSRIKAMGVENCYFPMFVSEAALKSEQEHVQGFTPEVAWVTRAGNSDLAQPVAIRPTSETVMYPSFRKWIRSHRDLPLKVNQWCNVVRWEFKNPTPFIRTREFLWQEGHTAHATKESASEEVKEALQMYEDVYAQLLAVPVIKGRKTEKEKFAGALFTTTVEAFIPATGRGIQGATSHCLGQNFGKMFDITFEDEAKKKQVVWQNSWGMTTRTIGVMIMVHGDDKGLVLPPRIAPVQLVMIPVVQKSVGIDQLCQELTLLDAALKDAGVRTRVDGSEHYTPGWKYNHWEKKGVPIRLEFGPRDLEKRQVRLVRRDSGAKEDVLMTDLVQRVTAMLEEIQADMLDKATRERDDAIRQVRDWEDFSEVISRGHLALSPSCNERECEEEVGVRSKMRACALAQSREEEVPQSGKPTGDAAEATSGSSERAGAQALCIPLEQPHLTAAQQCVGCKRAAVCFVLYGRSY